MSASAYEDIRKHVATYLKVFVVLIVLTGVTVGASYVHLVIPLAVAVAVLIALLKSSLVASFFMHLVGERPVIFGALALTIVLLAALILLPLLGAKTQIGAVRTDVVPTQTLLEH